ncbi:Uncharacterized membrane protein At3g27390 [Linum perenne]
MWLVIGLAGSVIGGTLYDGTIDTLRGCFTIVRDFGDVCYHSYSSIMDDLQHKGPEDGKYYEIRLLQLPGALIAGALGVLVDFPMVSLIAVCKSPFMLFKVLLWPLAVVGAVLGSMVSSIFLGAYAAVVAYQESSFWFGLRYIAASLAIYDEYSNDILDLPEGSCFPRPRYRKNSEGTSRSASFSRSTLSFRKSFSRSISIAGPMLDVKPFELLESLFKDCQVHGEKFLSHGLITQQDIEDAKSGNGDNVTEITSTNRPKDAFFDWFLNPFLIIKDQLKAQNLSQSEEDYLCKLVLLNGDPVKMKASTIGPPPETERKRAELDALARRKNGNGRKNFSRSKSAFARIFSQKSMNEKTSFNHSSDSESQHVSSRNVDVI